MKATQIYANGQLVDDYPDDDGTNIGGHIAIEGQLQCEIMLITALDHTDDMQVYINTLNQLGIRHRLLVGVNSSMIVLD
jgi:hypothetical protein